MYSRQEQEEITRTAMDKQKAGQTLGGCDMGKSTSPIPLGIGGAEVPTVYALSQRIDTARAEMNSLVIARQFLQNESPNGEQVALGLTALRALGYSL